MEVGINKSVFRQTDREQSLVGLMRVGILKRMESSINSFAITIENILNKINITLEAIEQKQFDYDADTAKYLYKNLADDFAKRGLYTADLLIKKQKQNTCS